MPYDLELTDLGTNCPVQFNVTVIRDGVARRGYFRARGSHWTLEVYEPGPPEVVDGEDGAAVEWGMARPWGGEYEAGWMPRAAVEPLIRWALDRWVEGAPSWTDTNAHVFPAQPPPPSMGPTADLPLDRLSDTAVANLNDLLESGAIKVVGTC